MIVYKQQNTVILDIYETNISYNNVVGSWVEGHKCVSINHMDTPFDGNFYDLTYAKQQCALACDRREDCFYADLYFKKNGRHQTCNLRGNDCGDWHKNKHTEYQLYHKGNSFLKCF